MSASAVGFHIELVIFDQLLRQVIQIKIILSVFGPKKLRRNPEKTFIPLNRSRSKIDTGQCPAFLVMLPEYFH